MFGFPDRTVNRFKKLQSRRWQLLPALLITIMLQPIFPEEQTTENVFSSVEDHIKKITLENGLTLIMMRRPYAPTVAAYIKFRAGSVDETDETSGIAHMLEHMLFKGTENIGTRDYEREKKYIELTNIWANRLDDYRRKLEAAEAEGGNNEGTISRYREQVARWRQRLASINALARTFMVSDEDSAIYSLHGQRGYNAYTSRDLTNYQIQLPANRLEVWARMESDRMENSVLRDFYVERNVVKEERRMRVDNVGRSLLLERFLKEAYADHPYGRSLIGPMPSIEYLNFEMAMDFYERYYAPNNTIITIVGDLDFEYTEELIRKYFGHMEPRNIPQTESQPVQPRPGVHVRLEREGSPVMYMAWFKPNFPDSDDFNLQVLSRILAGSRDSRLFRSLVMEKRLASSIGVHTTFPGQRFQNLFFISAIPSPGTSYDDLKQGILEEIRNIKSEGIKEDELLRARRNIESDLVFSLRSNATMADRLSFYELIAGDYRAMFRYFDRIDQVSTDSIQEAVERHLKLEYVMTATLHTPAESD